jgi:PhnB protein
MSSTVKPIPEGFHTITPHLTVRNAKQAIEFYKKAFGAQELGVAHTPDGRIMHALLQIGDSKLMLNDEFPEMGGSRAPAPGSNIGVTINLYLEKVDPVFDSAVSAGATPKMPPTDMFWGDRYAQLSDPFGHNWALAQHIKDMSQEEMKQAQEEAIANMAKKGHLSKTA